jgi:hypothetical protein
MSTELDLKEIERKAFRSNYQDGLWDMFYGLIVVCMAFFIYRPSTGYSPLNIILNFLAFGLAFGLFFAGKKYITLPRMGQVRFGAVRARKKRTLAVILGLFVLLQVGLVGLTSLGWLDPQVRARLNSFLGERDLTLALVAMIGSLMVGTSMIVSFYFSDFPRGYYIAILMALAVFLMVYLNQPVYPVIIGVVIFLPGLLLFVRFLKNHSLPREETPGE